MNKKTIRGLLAVFLLASTAVWAETINGVAIDFATIGNAGNGADTTTYGAVGYNYAISQTEISFAQFSASGLGDGAENAWTNSLGDSAAPAVNVSWREAAQYCNWLTSGDASLGAYTFSGNSVTVDRALASTYSTNGTVYVLPTENEWYKAAYYNGSSYTLYANGTGTAPADGADALYLAANTQPWTVGSGAVEQNGTYNMMGNVWEWSETATDGTMDTVGEQIAFHGGDYYQGVGFLQSTTRGLDNSSDGDQYTNVGFRVVAIPEPGTISLMSLSTIGLFLTRTIRRRKRLGLTLLPVRRQYLDTFYSEREWNAEMDAEGENYLLVLLNTLKEGGASLRASVRAAFNAADKAFWNGVVAVHERTEAFFQTLRQKSLSWLDAVLALIMK